MTDATSTLWKFRRKALLRRLPDWIFDPVYDWFLSTKDAMTDEWWRRRHGC